MRADRAIVTSSASADVTPLDYLDEVLTSVEQLAYYADRIDWSTQRVAANDVAADAADTADTYPFVRQLVDFLGDRHSQFLIPADADSAAFFPTGLDPFGELDNSGVGRIVLPGLVSGDDADAAERYSAAGWAILDEEACGWIVDLRGNGGGNLFPMVVAIAPLLGPGPTVGYRRRDGTTDVYRLDTAGNLIAPDGSMLAAAPENAAPPSRDGLAIAVLQGGSTASSGEGVLMALLGRPKVGTFGDETLGIPTGNSLVEFADGSAIKLTQAIGIDALDNPHETAIQPGIPTPPESRTDERLTADDRELLRLTAWEELTPSEIAAVMELPAGTVRRRLHDARNRLRAQLDMPPAERNHDQHVVPVPNSTRRIPDE